MLPAASTKSSMTVVVLLLVSLLANVQASTPWIVHIADGDGFPLCDGTLIYDGQWVVTAAQCLTAWSDDIKDLTIKPRHPDDIKVMAEDSTGWIKAKGLEINPFYYKTDDIFGYDIALIKLESTVGTHVPLPPRSSNFSNDRCHLGKTQTPLITTLDKEHCVGMKNCLSIKVRCDTYYSGAPLWCEDSNGLSRYLVGFMTHTQLKTHEDGECTFGISNITDYRDWMIATRMFMEYFYI